MSSVNLKNFVDINIKRRESSALSSTRPTVVLLSEEGTLGDNMTVNSLNYADKLSTYSNTLKYASVYFANGGIELYIIFGVNNENIESIVTNLDTKQIVVCYSSTSDNFSIYENLIADLTEEDNIHGIEEKIFVASAQKTTEPDKSLKNLVAKYTSVVGGEMTIAAYLSQIDVYRLDSILDYCYTKENIAAEDITNAEYITLSNNNINVDINLADSVRNVGGNCTNGEDLVNNYVRIILQQTLTDRLVELLATKIKSTDAVGKIYLTIAKELNRYLESGYLTTDKIWTDEDYVEIVNEQSYTIIQRNTALLNGYLIKVLPMSSLSDSEKQMHKSPKIFIILADQYSIRKIEISGEII